MNANYRRVPTNFGPDTRFEVRAAPAAPFRASEETELDQLKNRLLGRRLNALTRAGLNGYVRRAANEAVALAWVTQYPLLVFPALFDEMTAQALAQATRQEQIRRRSRELLTV